MTTTPRMDGQVRVLLRTALADRNTTVAEVARITRVPVSTLKQQINGDTHMTVTTLVAVATALGVCPSYLLIGHGTAA